MTELDAGETGRVSGCRVACDEFHRTQWKTRRMREERGWRMCQDIAKVIEPAR